MQLLIDVSGGVKCICREAVHEELCRYEQAAVNRTQVRAARSRSSAGRSAKRSRNSLRDRRLRTAVARSGEEATKARRTERVANSIARP